MTGGSGRVGCRRREGEERKRGMRRGREENRGEESRGEETSPILQNRRIEKPFNIGYLDLVVGPSHIPSISCCWGFHSKP
jgi:hypothetical protein